jgi:hypothetical protein
MIELVSEPAGSVYEALIALAVNECSTFTLVEQPGLRFADAAIRLNLDLAQHLVSELSATAWPGTQLGGGKAVVRRYRLNQDSQRLLLAVPSLYAWQSPDYPEDLAFYAADGSVWLGSVAHERLGFFEIVPHTRAELQLLVPGLHVRDRWTGRRRRKRGG